MSDKIPPERRSANMRAIRSKDMKPELAVRRLIHSMGYRFRLHRKDLPGKPDLVFPGRRAVIFVHGCFWHQHPMESCKDARLPTSNTEYWLPKLQRNCSRDKDNQSALEEKGWRVMVVWECELKDTISLESRLSTFLNEKYAS